MFLRQHSYNKHSYNLSTCIPTFSFFKMHSYIFPSNFTRAKGFFPMIKIFAIPYGGLCLQGNGITNYQINEIGNYTLTYLNLSGTLMSILLQSLLFLLPLQQLNDSLVLPQIQLEPISPLYHNGEEAELQEVVSLNQRGPLAQVPVGNLHSGRFHGQVLASVLLHCESSAVPEKQTKGLINLIEYLIHIKVY